MADHPNIIRADFVDRLSRHGRVIKAAVETRGIDFQTLASRSGIPVDRLIDIDIGYVDAEAEESYAIALAVGLPVEFFFS